MVFKCRTIESTEGPKLWIHTLPRAGGFAVEFHNNGATLDREQFEEMVSWVRAELDGLEQHSQKMRFVN